MRERSAQVRLVWRGYCWSPNLFRLFLLRAKNAPYLIVHAAETVSHVEPPRMGALSQVDIGGESHAARAMRAAKALWRMVSGLSRVSQFVSRSRWSAVAVGTLVGATWRSPENGVRGDEGRTRRKLPSPRRMSRLLCANG